MRVTASEFYTFVMFVFAVLGGVSHILVYHIHHRDMNADAQTISNFNEAVEQRDATYVSSILVALVTSDVNNNRLSESRLSRITVASVLEKFSSQLSSWDDAAALHNSTARDFFFPFFLPLSECVGANHHNNASTCVEEFLHDGNSSAMIGVVSHWMKRVVTTSMLTVIGSQHHHSVSSGAGGDMSEHDGVAAEVNGSSSLCQNAPFYDAVNFTTSTHDNNAKRVYMVARAPLLTTVLDVTLRWVFNETAFVIVDLRADGSGAFMDTEDFPVMQISLASTTSNIFASNSTTATSKETFVWEPRLSLLENSTYPLLMQWRRVALNTSRNCTAVNTTQQQRRPNSAAESLWVYPREGSGAPAAGAATGAHRLTMPSTTNTTPHTNYFEVAVNTTVQMPLNVTRLLSVLADVFSRHTEFAAVVVEEDILRNSSTALHHTCSSDPTGQMMRVLASSENLTVYDTTATVVLGAPACLQQQGQSIWPSLGAALSSLSAADSIALSDFTTTAVATEAFLCVAQHNVCIFPLLSDSGAGASPMWLVSYHHQQQSGSNAPDVPFSLSSSIVWPIIVAWAAALICCSVVLLATRRLYVLPTLALRSVLVAAFQATPAASPHQAPTPSVVLGEGDDVDGNHSFGTPQELWGGGGDDGNHAMRYAVGSPSHTFEALRRTRSRQSSLGSHATTLAAALSAKKQQQRGIGWTMLRNLLSSVTTAAPGTTAVHLDPLEMDALSDASSESSSVLSGDGGDNNDDAHRGNDQVHHIIGGLGAVHVASVVDESTADFHDENSNPPRYHSSRASSVAAVPELEHQDSSNAVCRCVGVVLTAVADSCRRAVTNCLDRFTVTRRKHHRGRQHEKRHQHVISSEGHELHVNLHHVFEWVSCVAKYVPKEVVSDIMRSGQRGGGGGGLSKGNNASTQAPHMTQRTVTLLFCDIENFTTFCEHVPPEDMVDLLEIYFAKMTSVLLQHGCTIDKYIGDAIMGFWGAPLEYHCQGFSACCAALHMQYAVAKLRPYFMRFQHHLNVRVGIHRGVAAVGNIGCSVRLSYTALGDVVNTAARLEGLNKHFGTRVCVSQSVVNDIDGGHFAFRALGSVRVKGKLDALSVYELIGVRTSPPSSSSPKDSGMKHGIKPNSMMLDTRSEAVYTHQTGLSTATDKFAELNVESELLTAKRFKAISERQVEVLAKIESAIQSYQRGDIRDGIVALEQVLHDHSRTLIKLDIDVGKLRLQMEHWREVEEQLESGTLVDFDPCVTMHEK